MSIPFIARLQLSDSGFAFDPQTGATYSLNRLGLKIIQLLREGNNSDQVAVRIAKEYGIRAADAARDVEDFLVSVRGFSFS